MKEISGGEPTKIDSIVSTGFVPSIEWPDPTNNMMSRPEFDAIWDCINTWDINVPGAYQGYCGATGNHVRAILDALEKAGFLIIGNFNM